jgi:3-methyladenine DNA glycosylase AlkC
MEQIAIDQGHLLASVVPAARSRRAELRVPRLTDRMWAGGRLVLEFLGRNGIERAREWESDTARGWGAMAVGLVPSLGLRERLLIARNYALDPHFSVREWAWIAVRRHIIDELDTALSVLGCWVWEDDPLVRRFATEATRPRGVWCAHIPVLKTNPELAINLLDPLRSDPARYVQLSVGNWLNDAAKTREDWTRSVCRRWEATHSAATQAIIKRGLRSLAET